MTDEACEIQNSIAFAKKLREQSYLDAGGSLLGVYAFSMKQTGSNQTKILLDFKIAGYSAPPFGVCEQAVLYLNSHLDEVMQFIAAGIEASALAQAAKLLSEYQDKEMCIRDAIAGEDVGNE